MDGSPNKNDGAVAGGGGRVEGGAFQLDLTGAFGLEGGDGPTVAAWADVLVDDRAST